MPPTTEQPAQPTQPAQLPSTESTPTKAIKTVLAIGSGWTTLVAIVTDVLAPLGSLTPVLAAIVLLAFGVCAVPGRMAQPVHVYGRRLFPRYWRAPLMGALAVSFVLLVIASFITKSAPEGGWVASKVPAVRDVQEKLGLISARTQEIADATRGIKEDTGKIVGKLDQLKQETSADPRKELANLGVAWTAQAFIDAMMDGDQRSVKLFLDGGMSPTLNHKGASAVLYILQPKLPDPVPVLTLIVDAGFDPNTNLIDASILRHYSQSLPPHFESPDLPADYAAWQGSFGGPALLWVVIRAAWAGPTASDLKVIEFLRSRGADTRLPKQFLTAMQPVWGDMAPYQQVRKAVTRPPARPRTRP
jgi:hypothetical protein